MAYEVVTWDALRWFSPFLGMLGTKISTIWAGEAGRLPTA
jgi:hypothetical protein